MRGSGATGRGARPRPHRRDPRQAGVHPGFHRRDLQSPNPPTALRPRRGDLRGRRAGSRRSQDLCAARCHRHHRVAAADRQLRDEQEDRRGHPGTGARQQGRQWRVPGDGGGIPRARQHDGGAGHRGGAGDPRPADRHGDAAGPHRRQRRRGRGIVGGAGRRRAGRCGGANAGAGGRDARRRRARRYRPRRDPEGRLGDGPVP